MRSLHSRDSLIRAMIRYGAKTKGPIRLAEFCQVEGMRCAPIYKHFRRGFGELLSAANLQSRNARIGRVTMDDLLGELDSVVAELRRMPTRLELSRKARFSVETFSRHIGRHDQVITAYRKWKAVKGRLHASPVASLRVAEDVEKPRGPITRTHKARRSGLVRITPPDSFRGRPLGFRELLHAPTSESGVIHLFGILSADLGIAVENIGPKYPDCRGVRADEDGRWRRIAIEFEHRSSNFRAHRHDPAKCDLIVCWEHDWTECPVEVLELKSVLERLTQP